MGARAGRTRLVATVTAMAVGALVAMVVPRAAHAAPMISRVQGADRYATAAAVSAKFFTESAPVAYLATGAGFADALASGPAAAHGGGPVLLTQQNALPGSTATELNRLKPGRIVVVGGTSAVSDNVKNSLGDYTQGGVSRISGDDRISTAAALSAATFSSGVDTVVIAREITFPDALTGAPLAAHLGGGGPLLLVEGTTVPGTTAAELQRLAPKHIVVLGGPNVIADSVVNQLKTYSSSVSRRAGSDRYGTSVDVSSFFYASAPAVFLATGTDFPDALAAGPPAGIAGAPVLLVQPTCIPPNVNAEIDRLNPTNVYLIGGTSALSDTVMGRTPCQSPTTTTAPSSQGTVTPGAFCSPAGATGFSSGGLAETCSTMKCDGTPYDQPRWRQTNC